MIPIDLVFMIGGVAVVDELASDHWIREGNDHLQRAGPVGRRRRHRKGVVEAVLVLARSIDLGHQERGLVNVENYEIADPSIVHSSVSPSRTASSMRSSSIPLPLIMNTRRSGDGASALPFRFLGGAPHFCDDDREMGWRYWAALAMIAARGCLASPCCCWSMSE